jgi:hypothetical protein
MGEPQKFMGLHGLFTLYTSTANFGRCLLVEYIALHDVKEKNKYASKIKILSSLNIQLVCCIQSRE